jgi:RHS repeat-associated protein
MANTNKLSSANGLSYGFDNNGNTTAEGARTFTYNQNQRLIRVVDGSTTKGEYTYNGNGQRVKKTVNGVTTVFHYSLSGQLIAESDSAGSVTSEYVYLNGQPLTKIEGNSVYYYHNDHLGTPQKMTDSAGAVVWSADYKPFGEATITVSTITNNLRFPGQYYDTETGLNYNYFRDYNPVIGRYVQADPIGNMSGQNHLFVYVGNNPIRLTDPQGLLLGGPGATIGNPPPPRPPLGPPTPCTGGCHPGLGDPVCIKFDRQAFLNCLERKFARTALTNGFFTCARFCQVCAQEPHYMNPGCWACATCGGIDLYKVIECNEDATTRVKPDKCGKCPQ